MRTTTVEHETEDKAQARGAESQRKDGALPVAELANAPPALLHPRLLLGLQAMAGNAAVADLIETRKLEPAATLEPSPAAAADAIAPPVTTEAPAEEATSAVPAAGPGDDELAALDAAADAPPVAGQHVEDAREQVAQDAEAELADQAQSGDAPEASGGGGEPGIPIEPQPAPVPHDVSAAEPAAGLARIAGLPPAQLLSSLGTVSSAVERRTTDEHQRLAANAPQRPRHPGSPATVESPAATRHPPIDRPVAASIPRMPEARDVAIRRPAAPVAAPELRRTASYRRGTRASS